MERATVAEDELETRRKMGEERFAAYVAEADEGDMRVARWLASPHRKTVPWANNHQVDYTPEQMEAWASYEPSAAFMEMPESEKAPLDYTPQQLIDWAPEAHGPGRTSGDNEAKGAVSRLEGGTTLRCDISLAAVENSDKHAALPRADQRKLVWGAKYVPNTLVSLAKLRKKKKTHTPALIEFARKHRVIPSLRTNSSADSFFGLPEVLVGSKPRNYFWSHPSYGLVVTLSGTREYLTPKVRTFVALMGMQLISLDYSDDDDISVSIAFDHASESDVATVLTAADIKPPKQKATAVQLRSLEKARAVVAARKLAQESEEVYRA